MQQIQHLFGDLARGDAFGALVLPNLDERVKSIFDHVLSPLHPEGLGDGGPLVAHLPDEFEQLDVLLDGPGGVVEFGVEMVHPLLAALLERPEVFALGPGEELEGVVPPLILVDLVGVLLREVFILLDDLGKYLLLALFPLRVALDLDPEQGRDLIPEEVFRAQGEDFFEIAILRLRLYNGSFTKCYN